MMKNNIILRCAALLIAVTMPYTAMGQSGPSPTAQVVTEHARASLILSADRAKPGETVWAALRIELDPGWHTYWRNPGDSGLPGAMTWAMPTAVTAGEIQWPAPKRIPYGPLMNFGFDDLVILPMPITISAEAPAQTLTIDAVGDWLVCAEICIPDRGEFRVSLAVDPSQPAQRSSDAAEIEAALAGLPKPAPWPVLLEKKGEIVSVVAGPGVSLGAQTTIEYFPHDGGLIDNAAVQTVAFNDGKMRLEVAATPTPLDLPAQTGGVLVVSDGGQRQAYTFATAAPGAMTTSAPLGAAQAGADVGLWLAIILAFAGGIILNLMPCVLPVLAMKAFAFAGHGSGAEHAAARRRDGLAYTFGVMATFGVLAGVLIGLRSAGSEIGWGFQLQSPAFVAVIAYVLLALGLNLSGVFAIGGGIMGAGESLTQKSGATGAFFTGALAVIVATPCTAPFMGAAVGYAMTQPPAVTLAVFQALALGLAAPFLVLSVVPQAAKIMPKPGAWMNRLKEILAFPMYASAAWMVWVLAQQVGPEGLAASLAGLILVALAAWLAGQAQNTSKVGVSAALAALVLVGALGLVASVANAPGAIAANASPNGATEPYSPERVAQLRAEGRAVFVNYTAAWCITCLMNERVALSTDEVKAAFEAGNYVYLKADWTNRDAGIAKSLATFGRSGVPLYVVYRPGDATPEVLPQLLTPGLVVAALQGTARP
jgi:thiol:disulfide interchange protein